jgi:hypothetical protein
MRTKLLALLLVTGGLALAETHISVGIGVGPGYGYGYGPPPPPAVVAYRPPCPGPGYVWINGYYDGYGRWFDGYWAMPPYGGAYWVAPRFDSGRYYSGYWGGARVYGRDYDRGWNRYRDDRDHDRRGREDRGRGNSFRGRGRR